jgi:hypothetical protein
METGEYKGTSGIKERKKRCEELRHENIILPLISAGIYASTKF